MKQEDVFYEALKARDPRFDGKFFVGVKTTGIYCRPICPAKPKRQNVEFFRNSFAAEQAGYRPCLRCRPESAPQSPAWIGRSAVVQRAIKMLYNHDTLGLHEDQFARLFGITARHLRRLFVDEIGRTPKQLSYENRLNLARQLIVETSLPITEIAFASGFQSIRRFNDAFQSRFKKSPRQIRRTPLLAHRGVKISLAYRPPFHFASLLDSYRAHRIGELEWFEGSTMHRVVEKDRKVGVISITDDPDRSRLLIEIDFPDLTAIHGFVSRLRSMFDLDSDPVVISNSIEADSQLKGLIRKHPGIRLPSGWDPFEVAISTILGQLVSVDRGRALVGHLIELLGRESGLVREQKSIRLFPTPAAIAGSSLDGLPTTEMRKKTLIAFSKAILSGQLSLEPTQDVDFFIESILKIPGIGPWTAQYIALKCLRHADAFPATDLILARALEIHSPMVIESCRPWRGYVAALMWREYSALLTGSGFKKTKGASRG